MPTYPYHCAKCDEQFEVSLTMEEAGKKKVSCPKCKGKKVQRIYAGFFAKTSRKS